MNKNTIVQFVCFQTDVELDAFTVAWDQYAKSLGKDVDVSLQQKQQSVKTKYKYVSRHTSRVDDFRFVFVKGRKPEHFNDCNVKVIQAGGYLPVQIECVHEVLKDEVKVLVFLNEPINIADFKKIKNYQYLNIYEAYFESSNYMYILEYFLHEGDTEHLVEQVKAISNPEEIGMYKECLLQLA